MLYPPPATALLDALNAAAGAIISLDPDGQRKLAQLQGKVFCLEVFRTQTDAQTDASPLVLYLLPTAHGIELRRTVDAPPLVTLSGSALAFARLGRVGLGGGDAPGDAVGDALRDGRVTVRGDAELAQALHKILGELDLDWEELLSRYIGDSPARKVGNVVRGLADWMAKSINHTTDLTRQNTADYLTEEKRVLVTELAMQRFDQAVNRTRADVDRLTRRVQRLERALEARADRDV